MLPTKKIILPQAKQYTTSKIICSLHKENYTSTSKSVPPERKLFFHKQNYTSASKIIPPQRKLYILSQAKCCTLRNPRLPFLYGLLTDVKGHNAGSLKIYKDPGIEMTTITILWQFQ